MNSGPRYRRIILHFSDEPVHERIIAATAEIARLLGLDFHVVFVEDEAVFSLAALPFGREIRLPTHQWLPIDAERIASEYRDAAEAARQRVQRATHALGISVSFDVMRGNPSACIEAILQDDDIIVLAGPSHDSSGFVRSVARHIDLSGRRATGRILFVPPVDERRTGPIVAVMSSVHDPSLEVAAAMAQAGGESLIALVYAPSGESDRALIERVQTLLAEDRVMVRHLGHLSAIDVSAQLTGDRERFIVLSQDAANDLEPIARARGVPVLLVRRAE